MSYKFKLGDIVYYTSGRFTISTYNPINMKGKVIELRKSLDYPIEVRWENGTTNQYHHSDLTLVRKNETIFQTISLSKKDCVKRLEISGLGHLIENSK